MAGYIQKIKTKIPYSSREVEIDLQGKNLILTGGNGCGKTQLLYHLDQDLQRRIVNRENHDPQQLERWIQQHEPDLRNMNKATAQYRDTEIQRYRANFEGMEKAIRRS